MMDHKSETPRPVTEGSQNENNHAVQDLVSGNSAPVKPWPRWFHKFGPELLSVIPFGAVSNTIACPLIAKVPGHKKPDGTWVGTAGSLAERAMTEAEAKTAHRTGAAIGILGRKFPALDIDTALTALAQEVADL